MEILGGKNAMDEETAALEKTAESIVERALATQFPTLLARARGTTPTPVLGSGGSGGK